MPVILKHGIKTVTIMSNFCSIQAYYSAMAQANIMLKKGIVDDEDIVSIEDKLAQKHGLKFGSIYRETDLINLGFRVNMSHVRR